MAGLGGDHRLGGAGICRGPVMSTWRNGSVVGLLLALGGTVRADDGRVTATLEALGAHVRRDEAKPGKPIVFVEVMGVVDRKMTDADLKDLAPLDHLRSLSLVNTRLTDAGLKHLAAF